MTRLIPAAARDVEERSDSIVISFAPKWYEPLVERRFSMVIRKRVPKSTEYRWMYMHMNAPLGMLCARARIRSVDTITVEDACRLSSALALSEQEIRSYVGPAREVVGCFGLGEVEMFKQNLKTGTLRERLIYHPPQAFFVMSREGKRIIDRLAGVAREQVRQNGR